jgi:hypothetical protein
MYVNASRSEPITAAHTVNAMGNEHLALDRALPQQEDRQVHGDDDSANEHNGTPHLERRFGATAPAGCAPEASGSRSSRRIAFSTTTTAE